MLGKLILTLVGGAIGGTLAKLYLEAKEPVFLRTFRVKKTEWIIHKLQLEKEAETEIQSEFGMFKTINDDDEFFDFDENNSSALIRNLNLNIIKIYKFAKFTDSKWDMKNEANKDITTICNLVLVDIDRLEASLSEYDIANKCIILRSHINLMIRMIANSTLMNYDFENFENIYKKLLASLRDISEL